jgi:hypothetical protein
VTGDEDGRDPDVLWELGRLLRDGPAPLLPAVPVGEALLVALALGPHHHSAADAGIPNELLRALPAHGITLEACAPEDVHGADVVLAAGWSAAPVVLTLPGQLARAVLLTLDEPMLPEAGWTVGVPVLGPRWMGGTLPAAASAAFDARPDHRRPDLVLVHGEEPFGLLVAQELAERREDLALAVSGADFPIALPFAAEAVPAGAERLARAFATATVGVAPPVRGWRPAALAMLACGLPVVAPDTPAARAALGGAAHLAVDPITAADRVEALLDDLEQRAASSRAGAAHTGRWDAVAAELAAALRALR